MEKRELVCIGCPMGCSLEVELNGEEVISVKGNTCRIGEQYGRKECTHPTRVVTSSVKVKGGDIEMVPVKTISDIPKEMIFDIAKALKEVELEAPVNVGDIVIKNVLNTGVDIVATRSSLRV